MRRITANDKSTELMKRIGVVIICALTSAMSLNFFLIPAKVMSAGMNGVAKSSWHSAPSTWVST